MLDAVACEDLAQRALATIRSQVERALHDTGAEGHAFVALDTALRVDQVRQLVVSVVAENRWTVRDGKRCLATATDEQRGTLSLFVGGNRFLNAEQVFLILADVIGGLPTRAGESSVASWINLLVVEQMLHPERPLAIWLTIAHALATGRDGDDLHGMLPDLTSAYDVLHGELPASGKYVDVLCPHPERFEAVSWSTYQARLLAAVRPDLAGAGAGDEDAARHWRGYSAELHAYVRREMFGRLSEALAAGNGEYIRLHPSD